MSTPDYLQEINDFGTHFQYDTTYMEELLKHSPEGFAKFSAFLPLSSHREVLDLNTFWVAKLAAIQIADCGQCLQLCVRMALEEGVSTSLVKTTVTGGSKLSETLKDVYDFATSVASNSPTDPVLQARINQQLDKAQLIELGVCIATVAIFPTIKRTLGYAQSCNLVELEIATAG